MPIPRTVDDHFLSYINPQEASALRAMGGGITASGGQRMMNGIPSFSPQDQAAGDRAASTDMPDDVDDPHGVGQPTSQNPMGGVPGVDDTAYDKAIRDLEEKAKETPKEKAERERRETLSKMSLVDALTHGLQNLQGRIGIKGFSIPANPFSGLASEPSDPSDESSQAESNLQKGGEVKVPEKVSGHFLAYINPQEAAMLRGAGGGITALGGQKMRNGIPIFDPGDPEGVEGSVAEATAAETSAAQAAAAAQDEADAVAQGPSSAPGGKATVDATGIMGMTGFVDAVTDPIGFAMSKMGFSPSFGRSFSLATSIGSLMAAAATGNVIGFATAIPSVASKVGASMQDIPADSVSIEDKDGDGVPDDVASPDTGQ